MADALGAVVPSQPRLDGEGKKWVDACDTAIKSYYAKVDDPIELVRNLREIVAALDAGGLTAEQKNVLYPQMEQALLASAGVRVDLEEIEDLVEPLDCSVATHVIVEPDRGYLLEALRPTLGDDAANTLLRIDRQLGVASNTFGPADLKKFFPLYNTIQLNKLILLGAGIDECKQLEVACFGGDQNACEAIRACKREPAPPAGIFDMVRKVNARVLPIAFQGAYNTQLLDEAPETYLQSFFTGGFADTELGRCSEVGFNVACNAVYSLDDPDDYCRELPLWDGGYVTAFRERTADAAGEIRLATDLSGRVRECGPLLYLADQGLAPGAMYQPTGRRTLGPGGDPQAGYSPKISDSSHVSAPNHRSTTVDRVVAQDQAGAVLPAPLLTSTALYYPHDLTRFALMNKNEHVSRLYSAVFAPYYCPEDPTNQQDSDCDSVPDLCDNCPEYYNPDQRDSARIGIGGECLVSADGGNPVRSGVVHHVCRTNRVDSSGCDCDLQGAGKRRTAPGIAALALLAIVARLRRRRG